MEQAIYHLAGMPWTTETRFPSRRAVQARRRQRREDAARLAELEREMAGYKGKAPSDYERSARA
jgi:hypothetical protein